jgi:hypothetical protein
MPLVMESTTHTPSQEASDSYHTASNFGKSQLDKSTGACVSDESDTEKSTKRVVHNGDDSKEKKVNVVEKRVRGRYERVDVDADVEEEEIVEGQAEEEKESRLERLVSDIQNKRNLKGSLMSSRNAIGKGSGMEMRKYLLRGEEQDTVEDEEEDEEEEDEAEDQEEDGGSDSDLSLVLGSRPKPSLRHNFTSSSTRSNTAVSGTTASFALDSTKPRPFYKSSTYKDDKWDRISRKQHVEEEKENEEEEDDEDDESIQEIIRRSRRMRKEAMSYLGMDTRRIREQQKNSTSKSILSSKHVINPTASSSLVRSKPPLAPFGWKQLNK